MNRWRMTCTVKVKDGAVLLPEGLSLPEGAEVQLTIPDPAPQRPSFAERYAAYIGASDDLPADLTENPDRTQSLPAARRERVQLPLVRCPAGTVIQPTPEELDASLWD